MICLWKTPLTLLSVLLMCCTTAVSEVRAEPLLFHGTFFLIDSSPKRLDLFSNPGVILRPRTYGGTIYPPALIFGTSVDHTGGQSFTDTIRWTYREKGAAPQVSSQTFTTGSDPIQLGFVTSFADLRQTGMPIPATLTVDLLNSAPDFLIPGGPNQGQVVDSFTYSFSTETPVPDPSTLALLLSGGIAAIAARRRRLRRSFGAR
jgi:hypothetical protein